jgi:3-oxoacyl-[acyl-carrier-protein] synthase II
MVNGEGAAVFILESLAHAEARGARIQARIRGYSSTCEPRAASIPARGTAIRNSIVRALKAAQLQAAEVGHVNAHGLSDCEHDATEAQAIRDTLGDVPVTAPKSFFGNLGAAGGAVEMVASVLLTLNYENADSNCPVNVVHKGPAPTSKTTALVLNQASYGQAVAMILSS